MRFAALDTFDQSSIIVITTPIDTLFFRSIPPRPLHQTLGFYNGSVSSYGSNGNAGNVNSLPSNGSPPHQTYPSSCSMQTSAHSHHSHPHSSQHNHHDAYAYNSLPTSSHAPYTFYPATHGQSDAVQRSSNTSTTAGLSSSVASAAATAAAAAAAAAAKSAAAAAYYYAPFTSNTADPNATSALHSQVDPGNSLLPLSNGSANSPSEPSSANPNGDYHHPLLSATSQQQQSPMLIHQPVHPISQDSSLNSAHLSPQSGSLATTHSFVYSAQQSPGHSILGTGYASDMGAVPSLSSSASSRHFSTNDLLTNHHSNHSLVLNHLSSAAVATHHAQTQPLSPQNVSTHSLSSGNSNCNDELAYQQLQTSIGGTFRIRTLLFLLHCLLLTCSGLSCTDLPAPPTYSTLHSDQSDSPQYKCNPANDLLIPSAKRSTYTLTSFTVRPSSHL
jgi:hypothetical protein